MRYLFLHGLGQTALNWSETVAVLDQPAYCPNLSDWLCGESVDYSLLYQKLEEDCTRFSEPLCLCGLSLGGVLALQYAIEHPDKVSALALIGTQYAMPQMLLRAQNLLFRIMPERCFSSTGIPRETVIRLCSSMMDLNFEKELPSLTCRVLVLCGERDRANKNAAKKLKARIPQAELRFLPNAGHEVNQDAPRALGNALNVFFSRESQTFQ